MDRPDPLDFLCEQVAKLTWTERARIRPDARFIDFGIDSVRAMDLVIELEQTFGIEIDDRDLAELETLRDVAAYVERKLEAT